MKKVISQNSKNFIELKNITKTFLGGKIIANDNISVTFSKNEVHALVGENGSGKSTIMNILFGLYKQDSGKILVNNNEVNMYLSGSAKKYKIGMVHQHFHLVDEFSILDNILIGQENPKVDPELTKNLIKKIKDLETKQKELEGELTSDDKKNIKLAQVTEKNILLKENKVKKIEHALNEIRRLLKRDLGNKKILSLKEDEKNLIEKQISINKEIKDNVKELTNILKSSKIIKDYFNIISEQKESKIIIKSYQISRFGFISKSNASKRFDYISKKYNISLNPKSKVKHLSVGERQMVEIMKVLWEEKDLIVLDEPTATLSVVEIKYLIETIKKLRDDNKAIIFISHKLKEVKAVADVVTILRKGTKVSTHKNDKLLTEAKISTKMVGSNIKLDFPKRKNDGKTILSVNELSYVTKTGFKAVNDISFDVKEGEIFGLAGIEGNGQEEVFNMIAGIQKPSNGKIIFDNDVWANISSDKKEFLPLAKRILKYSHAPIDRFKHGIVPEKSLTYNSMLSTFNLPINSKFFLNNPFSTSIDAKNEIIRLKRKIKFLEEMKKDLQVNEFKTLNHSIKKTKFKLAKIQEKYPGLSVVINIKSSNEITNEIIEKLNVEGAYENSIPIKNLSGGNQQKFVFGRELLKDHKLFLAGHPTRGLDISSIYNIYKKMIENSKGKATILYSLEINELIAVADRLAIFYKGSLIDIVNPKTTSLEKISKLMIGIKK